MGKRPKDRIRQWLLDRRQELIRLRHESLLLERALEEPAVGDEVDASVNDQERTLVERLKEFEYDELRKVQAALIRLDNGEYGRCVRCGQPIRTGRLLAYPEARLCLSCAGAREHEKAPLIVL